MDAQQYSLSWNHFHSNLSRGFQSLLKDQDLVDVTLAVDGKYFKAHKMVLSICSPYFKELFQVNPCKHPIVVLQDVTYKIFKSLLVFMYQGEVKVSQCDLAAFMKVAEVLRVKGLTEHDGPDEIEKRTETEQNSSTNGLTSFPMQLEEQLAARPRPIRPKMFRASPTVSPKLQIATTSSNAKRQRFSTAATESYEDSKRELREILLQGQPDKDKQRERDKAKETVMLALHLQQQHPQRPMADVKEEPADQEFMNDETCTDAMDNMMIDMSSIVTTSLGDCEPGETSMPGTLQCIIGKRGLPRLVVDGYPFYKKSTYKNKCFWYCKSNRFTKCPAVCWTINGCIVKWPEAHTHEMVPEIINPAEDSIVPIEQLKQVLIDAARSSIS